MKKEELTEKLADKEHDSWSRWMAYLFDISTKNSVGQVIIPPDYVERWKRQMQTPYKDLSEREKQSDRDEVEHILPIIEEYMSQKRQIAK